MSIFQRDAYSYYACNRTNNVPLPPRSAPNAKAHQSGLILRLPNVELILELKFSASIIGTIVAVKGILSINALTIADIQITK